MLYTLAQIIQQQLEQQHPNLNIHYYPSEAVLVINKPPNRQAINIDFWEDHLSIIARATYITIRYADPELYPKMHTIIAQLTP